MQFIPQVQEDIDRWSEETEPDHILEFFAVEPIKKLLSELEAGEVNPETAKAALMEKNLFEGRALYSMNCRPCHGDSVAGDGPMADGFKLRPIDFTDNGTVETIVVGYTFWRVTNVGQACPPRQRHGIQQCQNGNSALPRKSVGKSFSQNTILPRRRHAFRRVTDADY